MFYKGKSLFLMLISSILYFPLASKPTISFHTQQMPLVSTSKIKKVQAILNSCLKLSYSCLIVSSINLSYSFLLACFATSFHFFHNHLILYFLNSSAPVVLKMSSCLTIRTLLSYSFYCMYVCMPPTIIQDSHLSITCRVLARAQLHKFEHTFHLAIILSYETQYNTNKCLGVSLFSFIFLHIHSAF